MKGEVTINGKDAYSEWGISLQQTGLSALMTPAGMKTMIENSYRSKHGKVVTNSAPRFADRDITLPFQMTARSKDEFLEKYSKFCEEVLMTGELEIETKYQKGVIYRCTYISCTQYSEFKQEYAAFSLKLNEADPTNRD